MKRLFLRFIVIFSFSLALMLVAYWQFDCPNYGVDDASIFFVYAQHVSQGHGFVYNTHGEKVEGFSSLFWVLLLTPLFYLTRHPESFVLIFNLLLTAITLTVMTDYIDAVFNRKKGDSALSRYSLLYLVMIGLMPGYIIWMTLALMEGALWSCLLAMTTIRILTLSRVSLSAAGFSGLIALLLLTRPEAMLWCPVFILLAWLTVWRTASQTLANRFIRWPVVSYGLTLMLLTLFRLWYFGYPLPNTFYAKISPSFWYNLREGGTYFADYFQSGVFIQLSILLPGVVLLLFLLNPRAMMGHLRWNKLITLACICLLGICVPIFSGGDHFDVFRFYQPLYPLVMLHNCLVLRYVQTIYLRKQGVRRLPLLHKGLILVILLLYAFTNQRMTWMNVKTTSFLQPEFMFAERGRQIGTIISEIFAPLPAYPTVGTIASGGIKFAYTGPVIDLMGLNNISMGHSQGERQGKKNHAAFEKRIFYELHPDVVVWDGIWWELRCPEDIQFIYDKYNLFLDTSLNQLFLKGLLSDAQFISRYEYAKITRQDAPDMPCFKGFFSKEFLAQLRSQNRYDIQVVRREP